MVRPSCIGGGCLEVQDPKKVRFVKLSKQDEDVREESSTYLRGHHFPNKEAVDIEIKTKKWLKEKKKKKEKNKRRKKKKRMPFGSSCFSFEDLLSCLLSCMVEVDVVERIN